MIDINNKQRTKESLLLVSMVAIVSFLLALTKLYVGLRSNSICILLDATNSFFDIITATITIVVFVFLLKPKSDYYGYGRGEYIAAFVVSVVSLIFGFYFLYQSFTRIAMPEGIWYEPLNCILISVTIPVKLGVALVLFYKNKRIESSALSAITLDSFLDAAITTASLISFLISSNVNYAVDAIFGIVISICIIIAAIKMVTNNVKRLLKGEDSSQNQIIIKQICLENNKVDTVDEIVLHDYGYENKMGIVKLKYKTEVTLDEIYDINRELSKTIEGKTRLKIEIIPIMRGKHE